MKNLVLFTFIMILCILHSCKDEKQPVLVDKQIVKTIVKEIPKKKIDSMITKDFVLGKFNYTKHDAFEKVSASHSSKTIYLNKNCYEAFKAMYKQAKADGINLKIISGTRNFYEQKSIWERKWKKYESLDPNARALKILEYSSMPTSSRHHWGTDMDLNNLNNSYFEKGEGLKIYNWLLKHAKAYGFKQVYTEKTHGRTGYNKEKWHWSYMPLAETYLEFYNANISYADIIDFKGFEQAQELDVIKYYVNGISKD